MKIGTAFIIFLLAIVALAAEVILYLVFGVGAAMTTDGAQGILGIASFFAGLMLLTGSLGVLAPICAAVELVVKKQNLGYYLLLLALTLIGVAYDGLLLMGRTADTGVLTSSGDETNTPPAGRSPERGISAAGAAPEEDAYRGKVIVRKPSVGTSTLGEPGVFGEVENTGDQSLDKVEITIFFLNSQGRRIHEKTYQPVLVSTYTRQTPLRPGYIRPFGVKADDAPSEWAKKIEIEVTDVDFSN